MVKDSVSGADYFLRGFSLIRQPGIRTFVLIPLLVNFVLFAGAFYALLLQLDGLFAWLHQQIPAWLSWLDYLLWPIALITILVVFSFIFSSVINWIAAPFNGLLAEKVEQILTGEADISQMPVEYAPQVTKMYNAANCEALGITIPDGYEPMG